MKKAADFGCRGYKHEYEYKKLNGCYPRSRRHKFCGPVVVQVIGLGLGWNVLGLRPKYPGRSERRSSSLRDSQAVPSLPHRSQPLANRGRRYAKLVGDFYLGTALELHLDDPLVPTIAVGGKELIPVDLRPDEINDRPSPSTVAPCPVEGALRITFKIIEADMLANTFSRHARCRQGV